MEVSRHGNKHEGQRRRSQDIETNTKDRERGVKDMETNTKDRDGGFKT